MKIKLTFFLFLFTSNLFPQKILDFHYHSIFGREKVFQFFNNQEFSCRLKGQLFNHKHKLFNMNDSLLMFENDKIVRIDDIKGIRIKGFNFSHYVYGSAAWFLLLDTGNNLIYQRDVIVNERAVMASAIMVVAGLIVNYFQDKHVHVGKGTVLRVLDINYENLNVSK